MSVYIKVGDEMVPATEVVWIQRASCGCISGVTAHNGHLGPKDELIVTPGAALRNFNDDMTAMVKRDIEEGVTCEPMTWEQWKAEPFADCAHDPKWGRKTVAVPEGMEWASTDSLFGRRSYKRHIVTSEAVWQRQGPYPTVRAAALCGYMSKKIWRGDGEIHFAAETVTCRNCEAKAEAVTG